MTKWLRALPLAILCVLATATVRAETTDARDDTRAAEASPAPEAAASAAAAAPRDLIVKDLRPGKGQPVVAGAWVRVHYTGWLYDAAAPDGKGRKFDSSVDRNEPFVVQLGKQRVIRGWDTGIVGMRAGGLRRLVIPDTLAYGARGAGSMIPPHATLVFDVELIDYLPPLPETHPAPAN